MRQQYGGPKLPKELCEQVGDPSYRGKNSRRRNGLPSRKERRKAERSERKAQKKRVIERNGGRNTCIESEPELEEEEELFIEEDLSPPSHSIATKEPQKPLKSILKKKSTELAPEAEQYDSQIAPLPVSRAVKDRLLDDDAEIAALEKKLGIKKKKSSTLYDGLDDLFGDLGALDSEDDTRPPSPTKRKRDKDDEWLASKRRKALGESAKVPSGEDCDSDELEDIERSDFSDSNGSDQGMDDGDDYEGFGEVSGEFGSESESGSKPIEEDRPPQGRVRENPYIAPVTSDVIQPAKYILPALRAPPSSDAEALARLRRQIQGLLNRLSEANALTILRDVEQIYQNNPRGYVNNILVELLIGLLADETVLRDTFLILHAGFIAAIYKVVGTDFGAQMIKRIVSEFDRHYPTNKAGVGKQSTNLISVLAELYIFQVIGGNLMFDYIKLFLDELSEINTELLLRIIKVSGSQLRQDDPTSLKDIVLLLQKSVAEVGEDNLPVRTKFMIETIKSLKNNRMKTGIAASAIVSEHTVRMKKQLGSLNTRNLKGAEPLRIGLADIRNTDKKGKWWLVGASWRNEEIEDISAPKDSDADTPPLSMHEDCDDDQVDLLQLAREQRMNTDVRRAIFITIMSATDFKDAHIRLLKLNLKKSQELEIPRVIVHCSGCEKSYNPYYTLLARKLCSEHKLRKSFQFALWDTFKNLGEKKQDGDSSDNEDSVDEDLSLQRLVNLGKLYGTLMAKEGLPITSLKPLNFPYLKPKIKTFVEIMLVTTILESQKGRKEGRNEKGLLGIFVKAGTAMNMVAGLQYFLKRTVSKTNITSSKADRETVKWACKSVGDMLAWLMASTKLNAG